MSEVVFYNRNGNAIAYCEDDEHIYLFDGEAVAYFYEYSIYSYNGKHLGRFDNGWVRDNNGSCVFFTSDAQGGPIKPVKSIKPIKSVKSIKPIKSIKEIKPVKSINSLSWSSKSSEMFFR